MQLWFEKQPLINISPKVSNIFILEFTSDTKSLNKLVGFL